MSSWPESTCVECGERIPSGQMQHCKKGGFCSWYVPAAVRDYIDAALTNAAKLASTAPTANESLDEDDHDNRED